MMMSKNLSLYIHIPFCVSKCRYCDFLSAPADDETREAYIQALLLEIEHYKNSDLTKRNITTVFFGGGTPSVLSEVQIERIVQKIKDVFLLSKDCEISMEMNPGTVTRQKSNCYFNLGIRRVSIGLQSPDDKLLQTLGRIHTFREFLQTYDNVRESGIANVNVDLMSALPGQSIEGYCRGLKKIAELRPEHISAYSLIVEEGTPFFELYNSNCDLFPSEDVDRRMYEQTKEILQAYGYERYEISNYAKPGYECRHNMVYWERGEYLGLGLGSSSFINHTRYKNACDLKDYIRSWKNGNGAEVLECERERLSPREEMEEFMFLGLRMMSGVSLDKFRREFLVTAESVFGSVIEKMVKENLLRTYISSENGGAAEAFLCLTEKGIDLSNYVFSKFLL